MSSSSSPHTTLSLSLILLSVLVEMDKWKLLRSALQGKRESDSTASIHRNDGIFSVIHKQNISWKWDVVDIIVDTDTTLDSLKEVCKEHMVARDVTELSVRLSSNCNEKYSILNGLIQLAQAAGYCACIEGEESLIESEFVEVIWRDTSIKPVMAGGVYYKWTLPTGEVVFTRYFQFCALVSYI